MPTLFRAKTTIALALTLTAPPLLSPDATWAQSSPTTTTPATTPAKITLSLPDNTLYEVSIPAGWDKVKVAPDGKTVTIRALLTFHFLDIPQCYQDQIDPKVSYYDAPNGTIIYDTGGSQPSQQVQDTEIGIPGSVLKGHLPNDKLQPSQVDPTSEDIKIPLSVSDHLYNEVRDFIPRHKGEDGLSDPFSQYQLLNAAIDEPPAPKKPDPPAQLGSPADAFLYGDSLANARRARDLAYYGINNIDTSKDLQGVQDVQLNGVYFLNDPSDPKSSSTDKTPLTLDILPKKLQDHGLWFFERHIVNIGGMKVPMMAVRVRWGFEATFDPNNPPKFPLLNQPVVAKPDPANTQPAGEPDTQPSPAATALGISSSLLSVVSSLNKAPGITPVVGVVAQNNGTPSMIGANITVPHGGQMIPPSGWLLDPSRFGLMVGKSQGNNGAYIFGLSDSLNSNAMVYAGGAVSEANGNTRLGPAIGVALSLGLIPGVQSANSDSSTEVSVVVTPSKLAPTPCAKDGAAILWINGNTDAQYYPPETTDKTTLDAFPIFKYTVSADSTASDTRLGKFTINGENYLDFPHPGALSELQYQQPGGPAPGKSPQFSRWPANVTITRLDDKSGPVAKPGDLTLEAGKAYVLQISDLPPPRATKAADQPGGGQKAMQATVLHATALMQTALAPMPAAPPPAKAPAVTTPAGKVAPRVVRGGFLDQAGVKPEDVTLTLLDRNGDPVPCRDKNGNAIFGPILVQRAPPLRGYFKLCAPRAGTYILVIHVAGKLVKMRTVDIVKNADSLALKW